MFGWIPIIGPIIDGIVSIWTKSIDSKTLKYQADADVYKTEVSASVQTLIAFKDDIGVRLTRDIILFPISLWTALIVWDKIIEIKFPDLVWGVRPLTEATGLEFLPYAAMVFLFGNFAVNRWISR